MNAKNCFGKLMFKKENIKLLYKFSMKKMKIKFFLNMILMDNKLKYLKIKMDMSK